MEAFESSAVFDGGLAGMGRVHEWLDSLPWKGAGVSPKTVQRVRLGLAEAFSNAVLHAHGGRADLPVAIRIAFVPGNEPCIQLEVTDRGPGFALGPTIAPGDEAERGRGLMILRTLASRVEYEKNTLTLWIKSS